MGIGPAAVAELGLAAGLLVFLIGAAPLALVGLVAEAGVVEAETVFAGALGCPGGGRAAAAGRRVGGLVAAGRLAASGRGDRRCWALRREECCHGPAVAAAAATEAAAASSGVWVAQSWLQRAIISFGESKDLVLIWALM